MALPNSGLFLQLGANPALVHQQSVKLHTLCGFDASEVLQVFIQPIRCWAKSKLGRTYWSQPWYLCVGMIWILDFFKRELVHLPTTLSIYRSYMQELLHLVKQRSPLLERPDYRRLIIGDLIPLLIDAIPKRKPDLQFPPHPAQRAKLVLRAQDYIQAHIYDPITLKDLAG